MDENTARKYIKNLILNGKKELRDKAMARFKERYGHSFWGTKEPVSVTQHLDLDTPKKEEDPYSEEFWTK